MKTLLHDNWTVRAVGGEPDPGLGTEPVPAVVPGCVHLDLMAAGRIADPYVDQVEHAVAWVGRTDWGYVSEFEWQPDGADQTDLVALGLDTLATVSLNGTVIGETANQHRSYRFDVTDVLRPGHNRLSVTFAAGERAAREASELLGPRPNVGNAHPFNAVRKMAANYGWDWGPALITAGIWKPIFLESWNTARIESVRPLVDVECGTGVLRAHVEVQRAAWADEDELQLEVEVGARRETVVLPAGQISAVVEVRVPEAELWWPRGHGAQTRYRVSVRLGDADERDLDDWSGQVGFRTVTLDTEPDADGTPFRIKINDADVFARGVNWIPEDCFPSRVDRKRYAARLGQAVDAGVNLVRVWGGGLYESEDFYDVCDELGLLVWQDFLFACAAYAEAEPLASEVVAEAREAVTRLSPHPSLILWNGNNENIWGFDEWGWREELDGASWGWDYYSRVLPGIVAELDPTRPYCPGSPYSMSPDLPPNDPAHGLMHQWEVWNRQDYLDYRDDRPRFVSEFGWQGPATRATLEAAVHDQPLTADSAGLLNHQKALDGQAKLAQGLAPHLPEPQSFDDWHWAMSLNQARAVRTGIEWYRSLFPLCRGTIVWQLNDCWPVISWSAVDGGGRRKPMWYALRSAYADRLLSVQPDGEGLVLALHNDHHERWSGTATLTRRNFAGAPLAVVELPFELGPRSARTLMIEPAVATADAAGEELITVDAPGAERAWWWFAEDRDVRLPQPRHASQVQKTTEGYRVTVNAQTLLKDLAVLPDRLAADAEVDAMLITLLPGESTELVVSTTAELSAVDLLSVLRTANDLLSEVPAVVG